MDNFYLIFAIVGFVADIATIYSVIILVQKH